MSSIDQAALIMSYTWIFHAILLGYTLWTYRSSLKTLRAFLLLINAIGGTIWIIQDFIGYFRPYPGCSYVFSGYFFYAVDTISFDTLILLRILTIASVNRWYKIYYWSVFLALNVVVRTIHYAFMKQTFLNGLCYIIPLKETAFTFLGLQTLLYVSVGIHFFATLKNVISVRKTDTAAVKNTKGNLQSAERTSRLLIVLVVVIKVALYTPYALGVLGRASLGLVKIMSPLESAVLHLSFYVTSNIAKAANTSGSLNPRFSLFDTNSRSIGKKSTPDHLKQTQAKSSTKKMSASNLIKNECTSE